MFDDLRKFPRSGASRDQLAPGLRAVFRSSYAIYYRMEMKAIVIVRVLHGARDTFALAERGEFL